MPRDTDRDWTSIAEENPYWGVLSVEEFIGKELSEESRAKFFASGEQYASNLLALIRKYYEPNFKPSTILDFGCGVGRLLIPFSKHCDFAVGVDVAPEMRRLCKEHASEQERTNIHVIDGNDNLSDIEDQFDLVNSYIVIQHIPPSRGIQIIQALVSKIKVGGYGSLQLTYAKSSRFLNTEIASTLYYRRTGTVIHNLTAAPENSQPTITMYDYDLNSVFALVQSFAGSPICSIPTNDDDHLGVHLVFQRSR